MMLPISPELRLVDAGSKLACVDWLANDIYLPSAGRLDEDDLYATLTWLEEVMGEAELKFFEKLRSDGKCEPVACFYDTTGAWFEGRGPEGLAEFGRPRAGQPLERRIILLGLVRSQEGWPITHKVFPGSRNDSTTVKEIVDDLQSRFGIKDFVFVGDRGMVSKDVIAHLESRGLRYVLAMKLRSSKRVRDEVMGRAGRFKVVKDNLEVKEVRLDDERYVVCRNKQSVERDRSRREDILEKLRGDLAGGVNASSQRGAELRANRAYRRYLAVQKGMLVISEKKMLGDARYDGKWVIRTNVEDADAAALAATYKALGGVERDFRDIKSVTELRPVYHRLDPRVRAHVFICVIAKAIMTELEQRLKASGTRLTVEAALKILGRVQATPLRVGTRRIWLRNDLDETARSLLEALGISETARGYTLGTEELSPSHPIA